MNDKELNPTQNGNLPGSAVNQESKTKDPGINVVGGDAPVSKDQANIGSLQSNDKKPFNDNLQDIASNLMEKTDLKEQDKADNPQNDEKIDFKDPKLPKFDLNKVKYTVFPTLLIIGAIALAVFLTYPGYQEYVDVKAQADAKELEVKALESKLEELNKFVSVQNVLKENSEVLTKAIPEPQKETVPQFMTLVQSIAKESSVDLTSLNYSGSSPQTSKSEITSGFSDLELVYIQGTAKSDYNSIRSFLKSLESSLRIMTIENIRLSGGEGDKDGTALVTLNFAITAYAAEVKAQVIPDQPLNYNLTDGNFTKVLDFLKSQRTYNTDVSDTGIGKVDPFQ